MPKYKVFISSVQSEFANERRRVFDFIRNDELMGQYFEQEADLMKEHGSYPHNPYLAELMYQTGYIEKYGTGITENIRKMHEAHLLAPDIDLSAEFITTIWRDNDATSPSNDATDSPNVATNLGTNIGTSHNNIATSNNNIATSDNNIATSYTNDATPLSNDATPLSNDATPLSNDATPHPNDATPLSNDATPLSNDATPRPNDATPHLVATDHLAENKRIIDDLVKPKVKLRMTNMQIRELIIEACIVEHSVEELAQLLHKSVTHIRNRFITEMVADGILLPTKKSHTPGQTYMTNPKHSKA